ncbi:MAG: hypothetical protein AB7O56_09570 [Bauldia sp.]
MAHPFDNFAQHPQTVSGVGQQFRAPSPMSAVAWFTLTRGRPPTEQELVEGVPDRLRWQEDRAGVEAWDAAMGTPQWTDEYLANVYDPNNPANAALTAANSLLGNWGDEIVGAIAGAEARDEMNRNIETFAVVNPGGATAAAIAGALPLMAVPVLGAARGGTLGAQMVRGGLAGSAAGLAAGAGAGEGHLGERLVAGIDDMVLGAGLGAVAPAAMRGLGFGPRHMLAQGTETPLGSTLASQRASVYDFPEVPPRPFEADYPTARWPNGPPVDAAGRLIAGIDGRPLDPVGTLVAGRRRAIGPDHPLSAAELAAGVETGTGTRPQIVARSQIGGDDGRLDIAFDEAGYPTGYVVVRTADDLTAGERRHVTAHEWTHHLAYLSDPPLTHDEFWAMDWGIPSAEMTRIVEDQLYRIYQDGANPPGQPVAIQGPLDMGYPPAQVPQELWAEAGRAYLTNPNYIKTVAPDVAEVIRRRLSNGTIRFNSLVAPLLVGAPVLGALLPPPVDRTGPTLGDLLPPPSPFRRTEV